MFRTKRLTVLVATARAFEAPLLLAYGRALARCLETKVDHVQTGSVERHWTEVGEAARGLSPSIIVSAWPADGGRMREARSAAGSAQLLLVDLRPHDIPDIRRIVVPWSGNPLSLGRLRLASLLAAGLGVPGRVLRTVGTQGLPVDRPALSRHFRQVRRRERVELALSGVTLPAWFRLSDDAVGQTLAHIGPNDLVIVGGSNDWLLDDHPTAAVSWDIRDSVRGPVVMLIDPDRKAVTLRQVFQEDAIMIGSDSRACVAEDMVGLLVNRRQVPWSWKPRILERVKQISLGKRVRFMHAQVPRHGQVVGSMCIQRGPGGGRLHFLVLVPQEGYDTYLPVLARLAELVSNEHNVETLIDCRTPAEASSILEQAADSVGLQLSR